MSSRSGRSISLPITLSSIAVALSTALLVGWTLLVVRNPALAQDIIANRVLLGVGIGAFIVIMTVLILFSVFLVREIREVRRQTSFIDSVTHELKSPLSALKLCLETLGREGVDLAQRERLRGMMLDDVDRLSTFIDRVLSATRLGADGSARPREEVDLRAVIQRAAAKVCRHARVDPGAISVDVPPGLTLLSDEVAIAAVIDNLLDNAIKYSEPPPKVQARARVDGGQVIVDITDQGIGLPRGSHKRIFERFYRIPDESVRSRRGTGLGLYVVSELVRSLGGRIDARSPGPGRGTTMTVTLPRRPGR
ncbi:MAG: HAMP domain-containing sensor histidine kinase [Nannocystaceae bacterium]